jgi:cell division septal protein FtsQ
MASSRSSTPAGRSRTGQRSPARKPASRKRTATARKAAHAGAKKPSHRPKPKSKPKASAKPPAPRKAKAKKTRSAPQRPVKRRATTPPSRRSRGFTIAFVAGAIVVCLAAAYFLWFRNSSLVAVEKVTVTGIEGPEAAEVTETLVGSAKEMTTLNLDEAALAQAVSGFPTVVAVQADTDFPHGLTIDVTGRPPVMVAASGESSVPVAGDGTLLQGVDASEERLVSVKVDSLPARGKLEGEPLSLARVAGAAPAPLRSLIKAIEVVSGEGIEVTLKGGIPVKFGDPDALAEKWTAVSTVLANPQVKTLTHLDVRVPGRPAIGGAAPAPKED